MYHNIVIECLYATSSCLKNGFAKLIKVFLKMGWA